MQDSSKIDRNLPNRLDNLLKDGSLDTETEILKLLETLSEKLAALEKKEDASNPKEKEEERRKNILHKSWGKDPFSQER